MQVEQRQHLADLRRLAAPGRQDRRGEPLALCGNHDIRHYLALWADTYLGEGTAEQWADTYLGEGTAEQWADTYLGEGTAEQWADTANTNLAANLTGKLLLVHGELDDNVLPYQTLNLVDALIDADKDFDLLVVPGVEHSFMGRDHYVTRRMWDYLVRHLLGTQPPEGYAMQPFPAGAEHLAELLG